MKTLIYVLCVACLFTSAFTSTVKLTNGSNVVVPSTIISTTLNNTYYTDVSTSNFQWTRLRTAGGSYNRTPEVYQLATDSACQITCPPYSFPIIVDNGLYCQRDLANYYTPNSLTNTGTPTVAFKQYCLPDVTNNSGYCLLATRNLYYYFFQVNGGGACDYGSTSSSSIYWPHNSIYDCCENNHNSAVSHAINAYTDAGSTIVSN
jgi:hypothetical protein